jgi:hypothetical protein
VSKHIHAEVEDSPDCSKGNIQIETSTSYIEPNQTWERFHNCFQSSFLLDPKLNKGTCEANLTCDHLPLLAKALLARKSEFANPHCTPHSQRSRVTVGKSWWILEHRMHASSIHSMIGSTFMDIIPTVLTFDHPSPDRVKATSP